MSEEYKSNGYQKFKGEDAMQRFIGFLINTYRYEEGEDIKVIVELNCARPSCRNTYDMEFEASDLLGLQRRIRQKQGLNLEEVCSTCFTRCKNELHQENLRG